MLCAGVMQGGKDSCAMDIGGPLVAKNHKDNNGAATLIGVVGSRGRVCAKANYPGVYANVAHYIQNEWLSNLIRQGQTCVAPQSSDWSLNSI